MITSKSRFRRSLAASLVGSALLTLAVGLSACGGGGSSTSLTPEQIARFKRLGAIHVHKEERLRRLERELKGVKQKRSASVRVVPRVEPSSSTGSAEPTPEPSTSLQSCDQNISASSVTTCPFAESVFVAYWEDYESYGEQAETYITAYSSATDETYGMTCTFDGDSVSCSGGNEAFVTFPMQAIRVY
jgi:hypothetical protein